MSRQVTYNEISDHLDKLFHSRCKRELGMHHYMRLVPMAKLAFQEGLKEPNETKRLNVARRAANMIFTRALTKKV